MFQQIKNLVSCEDVCNMYGIPIKKNLISCLFHTEKKPSMRIYKGNKGFNCYSCGKYGSVIDLVMKLFNINSLQACIRISNDFNLGLTGQKPNKRQINKYKQKKILENKVDYLIKNAQYKHDIEHRVLHFKFHELRPKEKFESLSDEFIETMLKLNNLEV